jgi:hypothetical protein
VSLACFVLLANGLAETVRITGWNLEHSGTNDSALSESAEILKRVDPDIILLQGARDWKMCDALTEQLKPAHYFVLICSSFRDAEKPGPQVAVLSKNQAYFSWSEAWRGETTSGAGGFAFAAVQVRGQRLGLFSASLGERASAEGSMNQLLAQVKTVTGWEANKVQSFIIGLGCDNSALRVKSDSISLLQQAGYSDTHTGLPQQTGGQPEILKDRILVQPSVFPGQPMLSRALRLARPALTCDIELEPAKVAAAWTTRAQELERVASHKVAELPANNGFWDWGWTAGTILAGVAALLGALRLLRPRQSPAGPTPSLLPDNIATGMTSSYTILLPHAADIDAPVPQTFEEQQPQLMNLDFPTIQTQSASWQRATEAETKAVRTHFILRNQLVRNLAQWLKQAFVQKLLSDRNHLLEAQTDAALKAIEVDERLSRIEKQIQEQTRNYEHKIQEMTRELQATKEENRELIRARIAQVKLEMDAVRARMIAAAAREEME